MTDPEDSSKRNEVIPSEPPVSLCIINDLQVITLLKAKILIRPCFIVVECNKYLHQYNG